LNNAPQAVVDPFGERIFVTKTFNLILNFKNEIKIDLPPVGGLCKESIFSIYKKSFLVKSESSKKRKLYFSVRII
jgi:hypothetical protein